jgi:hypothetical protein
VDFYFLFLFAGVKMSQPVPVVINAKPSADGMYKGGVVWAVLTSFFLMWVFFYVVFQVFAPCSVQYGDAYCNPGNCERKPADPAKSFVAALVVSVIILLIIVLIVACCRAC